MTIVQSVKGKDYCGQWIFSFNGSPVKATKRGFRFEKMLTFFTFK